MPPATPAPQPPEPLPPYRALPPYLSGGPGYAPDGRPLYRRGPAAGLVYAGFWVRLVAVLIDVVPIAVVAVVARPPWGFLIGLWAALGIYWVLSWSLLGRSLGQRALGLRVVAAEDGGEIGVDRSLLRAACWLLALVPLGGGLLWAAFDDQKQGWHDELARTFVVRRA